MLTLRHVVQSTTYIMAERSIFIDLHHDLYSAKIIAFARAQWLIELLAIIRGSTSRLFTTENRSLEPMMIRHQGISHARPSIQDILPLR